MSSSIWTRCAGDSKVQPLAMEAWRVVEAQHQVSTRKLVDSDEEQQLLEQLLELSKPVLPFSTRLHYLLFTPFRYPPLRHGSRFGTRSEPSLWYGSETLRTAFAEVAYYRLLFLEGTSADLGVVETELTAFTVLIRAARGIDQTLLPYAAHRDVLSSPSEYVQTQELGRAMRAAHVEVIRYVSARDDRGGVNVGLFTPLAFQETQPRRLETWHCVATRQQVELTRRDYFDRVVHVFARDIFLVAGRLPAPAP